LLLTGCAACATGAAPDKNERRGFYGELSVGGAVP
jgi:hypothetical protein